MKGCLEGSFRREKDSNLCQDSHLKRATVMNLLEIHLDPKLIQSIPLRLLDLDSLFDWVLHHRVLLSKVEECLKGVLAISSFI